MPQNSIFSSGDKAGLVQKMIGSAYDVVKEVKDNLDTVKTVSENMAAVYAAAKNMHRNIVEIDTGVTGALGVTASVALPAGIEMEDVLDFSVVLVEVGGAIHAQGSGYFTAVIEDGTLDVTPDLAAPAGLAGATIRWTLTYKTTDA